jgi:hypothetical protein
MISFKKKTDIKKMQNTYQLIREGTWITPENPSLPRHLLPLMQFGLLIIALQGFQRTSLIFP